MEAGLERDETEDYVNSRMRKICKNQNKQNESLQIWETIGGSKETKQEYEIKQFPKMCHPTNDSVSIPLFVDGEKIVIEIKTV